MLPYLTSQELSIGGRLKSECSDFVVEEIPAYEPCGEGEHLFLWVEKTDRSAEQLVAHVSRVLKIRREDVGMAGLKDRYAVTRQWISVPVSSCARLAEISDDAYRLLRTCRHRNKLHAGHVRSNRFDILIRDVKPASEGTALEIQVHLAHSGVPNYFGEQRFGIQDETVTLGLDLLAGRKSSQDIHPPRRKFLLKLAISAAQAAVFNEVLSQRLEAGSLGQVRLGDVMQVRASGGCFVVDDVEREQQRMESGETVATGPMFGPKLLLPRGIAEEEELSALQSFQLLPDAFASYSRLAPGARRPLLTWPADWIISSEPAGLRMQMTLPSGVYATTVLREFMKTSTHSSSGSRDPRLAKPGL